MTNPQTVKNILTSASALLNNDEAVLEAQLLLQHVLNVNRAWLISYENDALQANNHAMFEALLKRRLNGEPIAYILGCREFYGLNLKVSADTLIPRPDTETLVEAALAQLPLTPTLSRLREREQNPQPTSPLPRGERGRGEGGDIQYAQASPSPQPSPTRGEGVKVVQGVAEFSPSPQRGRGVGERGRDNTKILDLGTGTGAIALAIAKHRPQAQITAVDASQAALNVASENAQNLNIPNVKLILSDWFSALTNERFDIIVSNPPYIEASDAHLQQGDLRFEPRAALASGADGLDAIRHIISNAPLYLNPHGWLMLEHGYHQASKVAALLKQAAFSDISHVKDLAGIERVTIGRFQVDA